MHTTSLGAPISPTEIIATIRRSAFPALITEGDGDVIVLRRLEEEFYEHGLTLIPAGCKDAVLEVFDRRSELPPDAKVMFIVDRDCWVLGDVPSQYRSVNLFLTDGYSIENDMFLDGEFIRLLTTQERQRLCKELEVVCEWFALAASRFLAGEPESLSIHPNHILDNEKERARLLTPRPGEDRPDELYKRIFAEYGKLLRGTTLFHLLLRNCREHKYSYNALLNMGAARRGPLFTKVVSCVRECLQPSERRGSTV